MNLYRAVQPIADSMDIDITHFSGLLAAKNRTKVIKLEGGVIPISYKLDSSYISDSEGIVCCLFSTVGVLSLLFMSNPELKVLTCSLLDISKSNVPVKLEMYRSYQDLVDDIDSMVVCTYSFDFKNKQWSENETNNLDSKFSKSDNQSP